MSSKLSVPNDEIEELRSIRLARIEELKERAKSIEISPLPKSKSYKAIAISVDASEIPIETDVVDGVAIRCADSNGEEYFQGLVATDGPVSAIERFLDRLFTNVEVLQLLLEKMKANSWRNITDFSVSQGRADLDRFVMELLEWGTLVKLADKTSQTILLKDGLLRGKTIKPQGEYLENLRKYFEISCKEKGNFLIGIAKESAVLEKNKVLLRFVDGVQENRAFYLKVPQDLLDETYGWRYLASDIKWGELFFVRVQAHSSGRVMTIEVPSFLEGQLDDVLRILADFKLRNLPERFRGLPDPIACAHENVNLIKNFGKALQKEIMR